MSRKILVDLDLAKNSLNNARVQNLAADPSSPVVGQTYFNTGTNKLRTFNGSTWDEYGTSTASGDVVGPSSSVDSEVALFNSTTGKLIKRATMTGIPKLTSGVLSAATSGTDYSAGTSALATGIVKSTTTTGALSIAASGTDYAPATSGSSALKGNGSGGFSNATLNDVGAATADYSLNSHKITNVLDPTVAQDAATKNYVDLAIQGINWKASVRAATTVTGTLATAYENGDIIDGVTLVTGDRILLKNQSTGAENGIYVVAASGAPTRATDADTGAELSQAAVFVREGTANADSAWVVTNDTAITLNTTAVTLVQFSQSGGVQSATTTVAGITRYATSAETIAKSVTTAAVTPNTLATFPQKFSATIGDGSSTALAVTHSLGTQDVVAQVRDASTNAVVECDIVQTSTSVTTFTFNTAPASNAYKVVIIG